MYLSNAREDPHALAQWAWFGVPVIVAAYVLAFVSCHFFLYTAHLAVEMIYPRYDPAYNPAGFLVSTELDPTPYRSEGMTNTEAWTLLYNSTSQALISMSSDRASLHSPGWGFFSDAEFNFGLAWQISRDLYMKLTTAEWTLIGVGAIAAIAFGFYSAYLTGTSEAASCSSPSVLNPSAAPAPQARTSTQPASPEIATARRRPGSRAPPSWT